MPKVKVVEIQTDLEQPAHMTDSAVIERQLTSPTVTFIIASAIIGAIVYLIFLLQPAYRGDALPYFMVIIAEVFLVFSGMISFWTILSGRLNPRHFEYHLSQDRLFGKNSKVLYKQQIVKRRKDDTKHQMYLHEKQINVDVFIPVYGEPFEEIKATAIAARDIYGKHSTYILDDGKSDELEKMAKSIKVGYIRRPRNNHAKAGNINYALGQTKGDFFVIFDADFIADHRFLYETVPFFEDEKMSFVQTPQHYMNKINFTATAAGFMQHVFYALIQAGKNRFNAAFCVGTNVIFRRSAVEEIGGMYFQSKSEDIWTSLLLHEKGYRSIYINKVLAIGKTPETVKAYAKQQLRWATGSFEIFFRRNPLFNKHLTTDQRIQYLSTTTFYFNGLSVMVLLLLPVLQIFFNLTPIATNIPVIQWALLYSGFYVTQIILSMYTMGGFKFGTLVLSAATFPIYIKALFNTLRRRDIEWQATNSITAYDSPFNYIRIQTYIFIFLTLSLAVGIWKSIYTHEFSVSIIWCGLNAFIFGYFVAMAMRGAHDMRRAARQQANPPLSTNPGKAQA